MLEIVFVYVRDDKNKPGHYGSSDSSLVVVHVPSLAVSTFIRQEKQKFRLAGNLNIYMHVVFSV